MSLAFVIVSAVSFSFMGVSLIVSLLSTRYLLMSRIKKYLLLVNLSYLFIVISYFLWVFDTLIRITNNSYLVLPNDWYMTLLMSTSAVLFTFSSVNLKQFSQVFGFRQPVGIRKRITKIASKAKRSN